MLQVLQYVLGCVPKASEAGETWDPVVQETSENSKAQKTNDHDRQVHKYVSKRYRNVGTTVAFPYFAEPC